MRNLKFNTISVRLVFSLLLMIISFPVIDITLKSGLDASYEWALNYLIINDHEFFGKLIYPYGPLGFLKHPAAIGNSAAFALAFIMIINFSLAYMLLWHVKYLKDVKAEILAVVSVFILFIFSQIDINIPLLLVSFLWAYHKEKKLIFPLASIFLTSIAVFIKSSLAIYVISIFIIFMAFMFYKRERKIAIIFFSGLVLLIFTAGVFLTGSFSGVVNYLSSVVKMTISYGGALTKPASNNMVLIFTGFLSLFILIALHLKRDVLIIFLLLSICFFGFWKHGIIRQDIYHYKLWVHFLISVVIFIPFMTKKIRPAYFLLSSVMILSFFINKDAAAMSDRYKLKDRGYDAFFNTVFGYKEWKNQAIKESDNFLSKLKLPENILEEVGRDKIDIYPWNLSYIPANNFNYHPRTGLQAGGYAEWLDKKNMQDFKEAPPEYVWFHFYYDENGSFFGNYDHRLLLNDEPHTISELFRNYEAEIINEKGVLLKYCRDAEKSNETGEKVNFQYNEWIDVPSKNGKIVKLKADLKKSFWTKLRSLFYKSPVYYIDYKLENSSILRYRFTENNSCTGLWISPYPGIPYTNGSFPRVDEIRIVTFPEYEGKIYGEWMFLNKNKYAVFNGKINFPFKTIIDTTKDVGTKKLRIQDHVRVKPGGFAGTIRLKNKECFNIIRAGVMSKSDNNEESFLVIGVKNKGEKLLYKQTKLPTNLSDSGWHYKTISHYFDKDVPEGAEVSCYVWNNGDRPAYIKSVNLQLVNNNN